MFNKKLMYVLALFIIVSLSMNAFSAVDMDDLNNIQVQSTDTGNIVIDDDGNFILQIFTQTDYSDQFDVQSDDVNGGQGALQSSDGLNGGQGALQSTNDQGPVSEGNGSSNNNNKNSAGNGSGGSSFNMGNMSGGSGFDFGNMTGGSGFDFGNMTGGSGFNMSSMMGNGSGFSFNLGDLFSNLFGGGKDSSNTTNQTTAQSSDVPQVVTAVNYKVVSTPTVDKISHHIMKRARDNKVLAQGNTLKLEGINKLFDSNFTNGHLLVYVDNNLVFNEITANDLSTPIWEMTDDYVGQHQISVEFTSNADSNTTNKYTENVIIE